MESQLPCTIIAILFLVYFGVRTDSMVNGYFQVILTKVYTVSILGTSWLFLIEYTRWDIRLAIVHDSRQGRRANRFVWPVRTSASALSSRNG